MNGKNCSLRTLSREYDCLAKIGIRKRSRCYWETRSNVKGQHEPTGTDRDKNIWKKTHTQKTHILLRILAVIGRHGSHLMIVVIFVTKITFNQEFPTVSLDFTPVLCVIDLLLVLRVLIKNSFDMPVRKRKHNGLRVWNFALLFVVFRLRHGREGV